MANVMNPNGFVPKMALDGSDWRGLIRTYYIPAGNGTATFVGDVVKHNSTSGPAGLVLNGLDMEGIPEVIVVASGTAGQDIVGVVVGFAPDQNNLMLKHRAASTARIAYVCPTEAVVFEIQEDALVTPVPITAIGLNATFTLTAGSAVTGVSKFALDSDAVNTTATFPLKLLRLSKRVGNAFNTAGAGVDGARFDVSFNTGLAKPNIVGV